MKKFFWTRSKEEEAIRGLEWLLVSCYSIIWNQARNAGKRMEENEWMGGYGLYWAVALHNSKFEYNVASWITSWEVQKIAHIVAQVRFVCIRAFHSYDWFEKSLFGELIYLLFSEGQV